MDKIRIEIYNLIKEFFTGDISNIRENSIKNILYSEGFSYADIEEILKRLTNEGLIRVEDYSIYITNEGKKNIIGDSHIKNAQILIDTLFEKYGCTITDHIILSHLNKGGNMTSSKDVEQVLCKMEQDNLIKISTDGREKFYKKN